MEQLGASAERLRGVYTIAPTPFLPDGSLDLDSVGTMIDFLAGTGVDGVVLLGFLGEAHKLSDREQEEVIRTALAARPAGLKIHVGAGAAGTDLAVARCRAAADLGVDGLLVAPVPVQNDAVIAEYYRRIDAAVDLPIVLHDYPLVTGVTLSPALVARLYEELAGVAAIKLEESPSAPKVSALRRLGSDIPILGGLGGLYMLEELQRGADGIMTGFSYPEVLRRIYDAHMAGDTAGALAALHGAAALMRFEFQPGIGLAIRKEIYRQRGAIACGLVRHPGAQMDDELARELAQLLAGFNLPA